VPAPYGQLAVSVIHTPRKPELDLRTLSFPIAMLALLTVLFLRLWYFQVVKAPELVERADATRQDKVVRAAPRGLIYDRNGELIAGLKPEIVITGVYQTIAKNPWVIGRLASMLNLDEKKVKAKVETARQSPGLPVPIIVVPSETVGTQIAEAGSDLPGIGVDLEPTRYYPDGVSFAHVLGHLGLPNEKDVRRIRGLGHEPAQFVGKGGVEQAYETQLMGEAGDEVVEVDAKRRPLRILARDNAVPGKQLVLSVDAKLQRYATQMMRNAHYVGGVVAVDPKTGEVLCMVSAPTFDQNEFEGGISKEAWAKLEADPDKPMIKRPLRSSYSPGSTFKIVTSLAAEEAGKFDPNYVVDCEGGYRVGQAYFKCLGHHGDIKFKMALEKSCNTYFSDLGYRTGPEALRHACEECGLGQPTGIDIGGEAVGLVPTDGWLARHKKHWFGGDTVNFSIGQGYVATTPMQMCDVAEMVANSGTIYRPHLVRQIKSTPESQDGYVAPEVLRKANAPEEFWSTLREAMIGVVQEGTARTAQIPNVVWAGKTGSTEHGKGKKTHGWFIGFAPAENPKIAICVLVEQAGHGGDIAAPIAKQVVQTYLGEIASKEAASKRPSVSISAAAARSPKLP
jgi:penicillin-binding protein 2